MADRPLDDARDPSLLTFDQVWDEELDELAKLRKARGVAGPEIEGDTPKERAYAGQTSGLTFSGGGIRSATFNLGVAQALAERGLLRQMDYLSTVSGGGYVGSWLTAWIRNQGFDAVEARLPVEHTPTPQPEGKELETSPVTFLRSFSNYLIPRLGLFSADTWAVIATYVRNLLLNQLVLISALSAFLLLPRVLVQASGLFDPKDDPNHLSLIVSGVLLLLAICGMGANVIAIEAHRERENRWYTSQQGIQVLVAIPLFLACWLLAISFWFGNVADEGPDWYLWGAANAVFYFAIWGTVWIFLKSGKKGVKHPRSNWGWLLGTAPIAGGAGGILGYVAVKVFVAGRSAYFPTELEQPWSLIHATVLGAPGIALVFILTAVLHIGLMGRNFDEANREWWSRLGGWLMIYGISWFAFTAMAFYAPVLIIWLGTLAAAALGASWIGVSVGGLLYEKKTSQDSPEEKPSFVKGLVRALAPQIFVVGMIAFLAFGLHFVLDGKHDGQEIAQVEEVQQGSITPQPPIAETCEAFWPKPFLNSAGGSGEEKEIPNPEASFSNLMRCHSARAWLTMVSGARVLEDSATPETAPTSILIPVAFLVLFGGAIFLSWRIDINQFSMHNFYRNRLIRAYMGASNTSRHPQAFTGFDPDDDFPMTDLLPDSPRKYDGPFHLVNINLNLVKGEELAWQQRKGASWTCTPLHSGFAGAANTSLDRTGFRPTGEYQTRHGGISLGMAMAISGAAVSPSMGQGTTAAMSFLLTVFDARLGWWLGNPLKEAPTWQRVGPDVGLFRLLAELFGSTNVRSNYVYLSDGGHFENMGMYELVRRRCRLIIASDGGADTGRTFGGLANAMRKCRNDFGIPITIGLKDFNFGKGDEYSKVHCAVGRIHYSEVDPDAPDGTLLFLKTTLTGDEPADVLNYKDGNPDFPNQSTADQFFDESQFESYRALGYHTVQSVFGNIDLGDLGPGQGDLCAKLERAWCQDDDEDVHKHTGGGG